MNTSLSVIHTLLAGAIAAAILVVAILVKRRSPSVPKDRGVTPADAVERHSPSVSKDRGVTPADAMLMAVESGEFEKVDALLQTNPELVNARSPVGETVLHRAATKAHVEVIETLLAHGADLHAVDAAGNTPLHCAAAAMKSYTKGRVGDRDVAERLEKQFRRIVEVFLDRGADVNAKNSVNQSPLYVAATFGRSQIADLLVARGAEVNLQDTMGQSILQAALSNRETVELLLKHGAKVNTSAGLGGTPLHCAVSMRSMEVIQLLLAHGANVHAHDHNGKTPLQLVTEEDEIRLSDRNREFQLMQAHFMMTKQKPTQEKAETLLKQTAPQEETLKQTQLREIVALLRQHGA